MTSGSARASREWAQGVVYRSGADPHVVPAIRAMKREIDRSLTDKGDGLTRNVKLGRGGIREIEFIVQALQLLYGGDDPWLREPGTLKAIFRLTERGYLAPALGRTLSEAYGHLRTVEHRLQILHEFQTHTLPKEPEALARLARRVGVPGTAARAIREFQRRHRRMTGAVNRAFREFFGEADAGRRRRGSGRPCGAPRTRAPPKPPALGAPRGSRGAPRWPDSFPAPWRSGPPASRIRNGPGTI